MNVTEAVARVLKIEGVEWVSCFPSNNLIEDVICRLLELRGSSAEEFLDKE